MISISGLKHLTVAVRWEKMYMIAFPAHQRIPGQCIPLVPAILSLAQRRGSKLRSTMIRRLVQGEGLDVSQATGEMQMFLNRLPLFYDLITRPEVWSSGDASIDRGRGSPPVDDEDGDEVDESSTTQPPDVEEWLANLSVQQDDGAADEQPDNEQPDAQTEQQSDPSVPSSSQTIAGVWELEGERNEVSYRHHSKSV